MTVAVNNLGLSNFVLSTTGIYHSLSDQLQAAGIPSDTMGIPSVVGLPPNSEFIFYQSPRLALDITVLHVPVSDDRGLLRQEFFYFKKTRRDALHEGRSWSDIYRAARRLVGLDPAIVLRAVVPR